MHKNKKRMQGKGNKWIVKGDKSQREVFHDCTDNIIVLGLTHFLSAVEDAMNCWAQQLRKKETR